MVKKMLILPVATAAEKGKGEKNFARAGGDNKGNVQGSQRTVINFGCLFPGRNEDLQAFWFTAFCRYAFYHISFFNI